MPVEKGFAFSQASLQDYADCARRFQLRYVLGVRWPDGFAQDSAWISQAAKGSAFHQLAYQHALGIPVSRLEPLAAEQGLTAWWQAYLRSPPDRLPETERRAEVRLSTLLGEYRLAARYDLLACEPQERAVIVDWKTGQRRPDRGWLQKRWQTKVYRYVLARAGAEINDGQLFAPEQIELVYWFARSAAQPERFLYDSRQHAATENALLDIVRRIVAHKESTWPLTAEEKRCRWCAYRTLCGRERAESDEEAPEGEESPFDFDLDLEQIAEIEF